MPQITISIKPNNHRIYQCPYDKKEKLLNKIIQESSSKDILVVCSSEPQTLKAKLKNQDIRVIEDRELVKDKDLQCDFLISYDMPIEAIVYMARVSKALSGAVMLLDESEQKALHAIESLLGRAIKQERVEGFEYPQKEKKSVERPVRKKLSKEEIKEVAKKRYEKSTQEEVAFEKPQFEKPKREFKKESKKDDKWTKTKRAPKVTGKKISIKARKPKED